MVAVTGATGQTGSKIVELLLKKGEKVRAIGRSKAKLVPFLEKGAEIRVGDQSDAVFLADAFKGADAAYVLIPPKFDTTNFREHYNVLGQSAKEAILKSGVKKVVFLSSLGAERAGGTGPVVGLHDVEQILRSLKTTDIVFLRPGYFMENTLGTIPLIKHQKINGGPMAGDAPVLMIATSDIAAKAAELLIDRNFEGHTVVELFGDRISYSEVTHTMGALIGNPELKYIQFSEKDAIEGLIGMGLSRNIAESFVELAQGIGKGFVSTTAIDSKVPNVPTRYSQFAREVFLGAFSSNA